MEGRLTGFWNGKTVLVTGGAGFLGSFVVRGLNERGVKSSDIRVPRSARTDLKRWENCAKSVQGVDVVIHLAAKVGGIGFNMRQPGTLFYENALMGIQLMEAARQQGVGKFVAVGTVCAYPKFTPIPFREEQLWNGYPEETNAPYGLAKKMLLVQAQAYRKQFDFDAIYLLPVNLYGPGDEFDPTRSHVIPALIKKMIDARKGGRSQVTVWGTGTPTREFLYVEDAAEGILLATEKYEKPDPVNLGSGVQVSIRDLVEIIARATRFHGNIVWDRSKPDGQPQRLLDTSRARIEFGFVAKTSLEEGIARTVDFFEHQLKLVA